ncbi:ABC transporter substrate-binding protein [Candidatus Poriferisocius sp.]|uniref:ABC transporter substrate-binding protein n=1 Tax=Candidatus Poriferisocius sp. TaxID=3101276 RepID=UPI003B51A51C
MAARFWKLALILAALTLVASACGNAGNDDEGGAPAPITAPAAPEETDDEPAPAPEAEPEPAPVPEEADDEPALAPEEAGDDEPAPDGEPEAEPEPKEPEHRHTFVPISGVPGVNDNEIKVTSIVTISNNMLGTNIAAYNDGIEAYFNYINDTGGIYGRELVLANKRDDQLFSNQAESLAMVEEDDSLAAFVATLLFFGADTLNDAGVPVFGWNIHNEFADRWNIVGNIAPSCIGCIHQLFPWVATQVGATKVGIFGYGNSENSKICAEGTRDSIEHYSAEAGGMTVEFFDTSIEFGLAGGVAPQVSEMKDNGVDFIFTCLDLNGMRTIAQELVKQDYRDQVTMYHPNTYNHEFVAANADLFEGDLVFVQFVPFEAEIDSELQRRFFEYTEGLKLEEQTIVGWLNAHLFYDGLLAAGPEFDRASLMEAVRSFEDYSHDGLTNPIDWNRQIPLPNDNIDADYEYRCVNGVQVQDGAFVQWTGEPGEPWVCWEVVREDWHDPEALSFVN